ncbi:MAG TPA: DoxX family protein [bacterium]|nr:DoxX family protein [bacterium]
MDIALLILRLTVGLLMAGHGAQKFFGWFGGHGLKGVAGWLHSAGFRPAGTWAVLAGLTEFAGGVLFALGLFSPLGTLGIGASMLIAISKFHWPKVWVTEGGFEYALVNLAVAAAVGIAGPGVFSLDGVYGTALPQGALPVGAALVILGWLLALASSRTPVAAKET